MTAIGERTLPLEIRLDLERIGAAIDDYRSGRITAEEFRPRRLHFGIYGQRQKGDVQMVRVKAPSGILTAAQLRALAHVARTWGGGVGHITTRQDVQFHHVPLEQCMPLLEHLAVAGITTREACGNTVRNVVCAPTAGVDPAEPFDVSRAATALTRHFIRDDLTQRLPRKFKVNFSITEARDEACARISDIGVFPKIVNGERGFKVLVGGGLGGSPQEAQLLTEFWPEDRFLPLCRAIITLFNAEGNRVDRSKARMKFLMRRYGVEAFRRRVFETYESFPESAKRLPLFDTPEGLAGAGRPVAPNAAAPRVDEKDPGYRAWRAANARPQRQQGYFMALATVPLGDISAAQFDALADAVLALADGALRTTVDQNLLFRWVPAPNLPALYHALARMGLASPGAGRVGDPVACPGAHTCNLAYTRSKGLARDIQDAFRRSRAGAGGEAGNGHDALSALAPDLDGVTVKISGCFNSCGQHQVATIGFHGITRKHDGGVAPYYMLHLGGGVGQEGAVLGRSIMKIPASRATKAIALLVDYWRSHRGESGQSFADFARTVDKETAVEILKGLTFEANPGDDVYFDAHETERFVFGELGASECAS
ncbi:MAG: nitrite/sulfite reductase [Planctomycetes bacterium]|nr:nitrite/sulfite reductase [Planctomycetota bacterium]